MRAIVASVAMAIVSGCPKPAPPADDTGPVVDEDTGATHDVEDSGDSGDSGDCVPLTWYPDFDGDGYGADGASVSSCVAPPHHVAEAGDCDDANPAASPGSREVCDDGIDNDCDGDLASSTTGPLVSGGVEDVASLQLEGSNESIYWLSRISGRVDLDDDGADEVVFLDGSTLHFVPGSTCGDLALDEAVAWTLETTAEALWLDVVLADLDGDGHGDLTSVGRYLAEGQASVLFGPLEDRTTEGEATLFFESEAVSFGGVGTGDFDGDGVLDLAFGDLRPSIVTSMGTGTVRPYESGDHVFVGELPGSKEHVRIDGDLDGDGHAELVVGGETWGVVDGDVSVFPGPLPLEFGIDDRAAHIDGVSGTLLARQLDVLPDIDGDGDDELVVLEELDLDGMKLRVFLGPISGTVGADSADATLDITHWGGSSHPRVTTADLDGDGAGDLVVGNWTVSTYQGRAWVFFGTAALDELETADVTLRPGSDAERFAYWVHSDGDHDGDGLPDVTFTARRESSDGVWAWVVPGHARE